MRTHTAPLAQPELAAITVAGHTRSAFLTRAMLAAGAVYGAASVSPFVSSSLAQAGGGDVEILNFALTLEYLEGEFYTQGIKEVDGLSKDARELATELRDNEAEHVTALKEAITAAKGEPVAKPTVDFGDAFTSETAFLKLANTFEDTGVSAYNGAGPMLQSKELLAAAGSIVQIEARHAALIRLLRDEPPAPQTFDPASDMQEVLDAVMPFIKG